MNLRRLLGFPELYGRILVGATDIRRAEAWYKDTFGFVSESQGRDPSEIYLGYSSEDSPVYRLITIRSVDERQMSVFASRHVILFTRELESIRGKLLAKMVNVSVIQQDSGGNQFFRFQDSEGNWIEVCIEPGSGSNRLAPQT
jgi:catechol 2,3-dioxygenase-like lactoylglutathione lyase family enzyme